MRESRLLERIQHEVCLEMTFRDSHGSQRLFVPSLCQELYSWTISPGTHACSHQDQAFHLWNQRMLRIFLTKRKTLSSLNEPQRIQKERLLSLCLKKDPGKAFSWPRTSLVPSAFLKLFWANFEELLHVSLDNELHAFLDSIHLEPLHYLSNQYITIHYLWSTKFVKTFV